GCRAPSVIEYACTFGQRWVGRLYFGAMARIPATFAMAQRHHPAGRLVEAERAYREILAVDPRHVGSLQFLGVIAHQSGRSDIAVHLIGRALAVDPGSAEAHVNLA